MSVNGISSESLAAQGIPASSGSSSQNPRLAALERKLQRLNQEKKKAVENKDKEKARKLEQEIQAVKQQIEQLKKKEKKKSRMDRHLLKTWKVRMSKIIRLSWLNWDSK